MTPPIIVNESKDVTKPGDVTFFGSKVEAEAYMEPTDVRNNEYFAFDSCGVLLTIQTDGSRVFIDDAGEGPKHRDLLVDILSEFFQRVGFTEDWCRQASLSELVAKGIAESG